MNPRTPPQLAVSPALGRLPGVAHAFFTRAGGTSGGGYASLNCGLHCGDDARRVAANRDLACAHFALKGASLVTLRQVHGTDVVVVDGEPPGPDIRGDALVSTTPGVLIGVLTADCVPVLIADAARGVVAAAHAGWRGAAAGVIGATVDAMERAGARRGAMRAAIGPAIRQSSYEVGDDVREAVTADGGKASGLFRENGDRYLFDLPGFARLLCTEAGIAAIDDIGHDTYRDESRYFSHRRSCHRGEGACGRQLSTIALV